MLITLGRSRHFSPAFFVIKIIQNMGLIIGDKRKLGLFYVPQNSTQKFLWFAWESVQECGAHKETARCTTLRAPSKKALNSRIRVIAIVWKNAGFYSKESKALGVKAE